MNYIEYMHDGNKTGYSEYVPLKTVIGPTSNLVLKRNNWIKAIHDAAVQIKNLITKNNTVGTSSAKSTTNDNVSTVNNTSSYAYTYPTNNNFIINRVHRPLGDE